MKKIRGVVLILLVAFFINLVSGIPTLSGINVTTVYSPYNTFSGSARFVISGESADSIFSSNFGQTITLKDFLDANMVSSNCDTYNCSDMYAVLSQSPSETISVFDKAYFGFLVYSKSISSIDFSVSSNFGRQNKIPLTIKPFEGSIWMFKDGSGEYGDSNYGCYSSSASKSPTSIWKSSFCEKIFVNNTKSLMIGANYSGVSDGQLTMSLRDMSNNPKNSCTLATGSNSCVVSSSDLFNGDYYVCINADINTNYSIFSESSGNSCGWFNSVPANYTSDYSLFARPEKFGVARTISSSELGNLVSIANNYLSTKYYNRDCSSGCILPVEVFGINQNLNISSVTVRYTTSSSNVVLNNVSELNPVSAKINFIGNLSLDALGFNVSSSGNKTFSLYFNGNKLFDRQINVISAPVIDSVYPVVFPAGVNVNFVASLESADSNVSYFWDFGDGQSQITNISSVQHRYDNISSYSIGLGVINSQGFSDSKNFTVNAVSPQNAINSTLALKRAELVNATSDANLLPSWFYNILDKRTNLSEYKDEIDSINSRMGNAISDSDFLNIIEELNSMDVPGRIYASESSTLPLTLTDSDSVNLDPVVDVAGGAIDNGSNYKSAVAEWQRENIIAMITKQKIAVIRDITGTNVILTDYSVILKSNSDMESYFVIPAPRSDIVFSKEDNSIISAGAFTVVVIDKMADKNFEFYVLGDSDLSLFVSPKPSLLPLPSTVSACNHNLVCEVGENTSNCPDDCKSYGKMIFYLILLFLFAVVVYILLELWYRKRYENFLFRDRRQLYNLLMFIENAKQKGMKDDEIKEALRKNKWTGEQISYAIKKSYGKTPGMFQIIPFEKIAAYRRRKQAAKNAVNNLRPMPRRV